MRRGGSGNQHPPSRLFFAFSRIHSPPSQAPKPPRRGPYDDRCASWASDEEEKEAASDDASSAAPSSSSSSSSDCTPPPARPPPASAASLLAPAVDAAIVALGGRVLPKLNWSAPLDAAWMVPNNCIACENADEVRGEEGRIGSRAQPGRAPRASVTTLSLPLSTQVLLLLQASDRISDDLDQLARLGRDGGGGGGSGAPPQAATLALRRWRALRPGREVRAFVVGGALAALCQRDVTQHVPGMAEQRTELATAVGALFRETVGPAFAAACAGHAPCSSPPPPSPSSAPPASSTPPPPALHYTFDAYVHASGRARLIDINPVGGATAPLLFEWGDLFPEWRDEGEEGGGGRAGGGRGERPARPPPGEEAFAWGGGASHTPIPFRVVDASGPAIAPGRTLYGAPHDFVAGGAGVEDLARRLRAGELGPMAGPPQ